MGEGAAHAEIRWLVQNNIGAELQVSVPCGPASAPTAQSLLVIYASHSTLINKRGNCPGTTSCLWKFHCLHLQNPLHLRMNHFSPQPETPPPRFLFRVECHDRSSRHYNCSFNGFDMTAKDPTRGLDGRAFDDHLSWTRRPTPFLSFFSDWDVALKKRRRMLDKEANNVVIIVIRTEGLRNLYSAYDIARRLRYTGNGQDRRRQLGNHFKEFLVVGGIRADEDRILATFHGDGPERVVSLSIPGLRAGVSVTSDFAPTGTDATQELQDEIYSCIGPKANDILVPLVLYLSKIPSNLISYREERVV